MEIPELIRATGRKTIIVQSQAIRALGTLTTVGLNRNGCILGAGITATVSAYKIALGALGNTGSLIIHTIFTSAASLWRSIHNRIVAGTGKATALCISNRAVRAGLQGTNTIYFGAIGARGSARGSLGQGKGLWHGAGPADTFGIFERIRRTR